MIRAVVFDMDGLLIDSEPLWIRSEIEVFAGVGLALTPDDCARTKGLRTDDVVAYWYARRPWTGATPAEVERRLIERVAVVIGEEGVALPGVASAIEAARAGGRRIAVASSSPSVIIRAALGRLGLDRTFDVVQSAETEPYGKPHPGIFLTTASKLGVPPLECVVLEDSVTGVIAAKAARMACIAVPFELERGDPRFVVADAVLPTLEHATPELFARF